MDFYQSPSMIVPLVVYECENNQNIQYIDVASLSSLYGVDLNYLRSFNFTVVKPVLGEQDKLNKPQGVEVISTDDLIVFSAVSIQNGKNLSLFGHVYDFILWRLGELRKKNQHDAASYSSLDDEYFFSIWRMMFSGIPKEKLFPLLDRVTEFVCLDQKIVPKYRALNVCDIKVCCFLNALARPDKFTKDNGENVYRVIEQLQKELDRKTIKQIMLLGVEPYLGEIRNLIKDALLNKKIIFNQLQTWTLKEENYGIH